MLEFYQHIPEHLNPTFSVGFFSVSWYSLMYLVGFFVVYLLLRYRMKRGETDKISNSPNCLISNKISNTKFPIPNEIQNSKFQKNFLLDLLIYVFIGLLIGARLGYVLFYDFRYFLENPLAVISPFGAGGEFVGIYGMSYHGGLLGALLFGWIYCKRHRVNFIRMADFVAPAIPAGYFFGRIGNFLNGELYGRATEKWWGMYFPTDPAGLLRHPSQLYEAFFEGIVLFLIIWPLRNKFRNKGQLLGLYIVGYSFFRLLCEFFREPDSQIGYLFGFLTLGQVLSFLMFVSGGYLVIRKPKNMV